MNYETILLALEAVGLKNEFVNEFESFVDSDVLLIIKTFDNIRGPGTLIRKLMKKYNEDSDKWKYWRKVFIYFITPVFFRDTESINR